jgi:hypothetical protein
LQNKKNDAYEHQPLQGQAITAYKVDKKIIRPFTDVALKPA